MDNSKIKIVEFGDECSGTAISASAPAAPERSRGSQSQDNGIKIKEFDFGYELPEKHVVRAEDIKNIKIVEFDNEPLHAGKKTHHNTRGSSTAVHTPASINVFEYDDQGRLIEKTEKETRHNGIKIVEF